jgi:hypothetical protein
VSRSIYRMNPDGSGRAEVIRNGSAPSVDRYRTEIAFVRDDEIWIAAVDGSGQQRITPGEVGGIHLMRCNRGDSREIIRGGVTHYLGWSADGGRLVYAAGTELLWVDVEVPGVGHPIPDVAAIVGRPSWSPDGTRIVVTRSKFVNRGIWTFTVDGTDAVRIADIRDQSSRPDWGYPVGPVVAQE